MQHAFDCQTSHDKYCTDTCLRNNIFLILLFVSSCAVVAGGKPELQAKWYHFDADSIRVDFALPQTTTPRPCIIVLADRFGVQPAVLSIVKILAQEGFRAYSIPLRSTPICDVGSFPSVEIDSLDVSTLSQVTIEILNEPGSTGNAGLFAFDVGATIGAIAASRFPIFKAVNLFYPAFPETMKDILPDVQGSLYMHVGQRDPNYSLERINDIRETFMERGKIMNVNFYKDTEAFFCNPTHRNYKKRSVESSWNEAFKFLFSHL